MLKHYCKSQSSAIGAQPAGVRGQDANQRNQSRGGDYFTEERAVAFPANRATTTALPSGTD